MRMVYLILCKLVRLPARHAASSWPKGVYVNVFWHEAKSKVGLYIHAKEQY